MDTADCKQLSFLTIKVGFWSLISLPTLEVLQIFKSASALELKFSFSIFNIDTYVKYTPTGTGWSQNVF